MISCIVSGFPSGSAVKNSLVMQEKRAGDVDPTPGSGRSPGEGNGNPLQYSCHRIILAWKIPQTEESGGYNPWGHKSRT